MDTSERIHVHIVHFVHIVYIVHPNIQNFQKGCASSLTILQNPWNPCSPA